MIPCPDGPAAPDRGVGVSVPGFRMRSARTRLTLFHKKNKTRTMSMSDLHPLARAGGAAPSFGVTELGAAIGLRRGRVHEILGESADIFAILAAAQHGRDVVWIGLRRDIEPLCPTGIAAYADPARFILVEAVSRGEILWAADQALRAEGGFSVILDIADGGLSLRESRRLQLAAEQGGALGLALIRGGARTSAAQTRWLCRAIADVPAAWSWTCLKGKNGEAGHWRAHCEGGGNAKDTLHLAATASA